MALRSRAPLDRDVKLQRHPDLVRSIARPDAIFPAGRPAEAVQLSLEALEILDGFARPCRIRDVVPDANDDVLAALDEWIERGLLLRTSRSVPVSGLVPREARLWAGSVARVRRRVSRLKPVRRERLRGFQLAVVDGVFTEAQIEAASECVHDLSFTKIITDGREREVYEIPGRVPLIECITAVVERVFPRLQLELYWAYCNRLRFGDMAFAHTDTQTPSLTALYFANARWEDEWAGETLFYGSPDEATSVVAPRPGRLAIFEGQIGHRGGVPSRLCHEDRFAIAVRYWIRDTAP